MHPALAVLDTEVVSLITNTAGNNAVIYRWIGEGFDGMRSDMTKLSGTIEDDPSKALLFEALKPEILKTFKDPAERKQASDWAKQQEDKDGLFKTLLGGGAVGLTVGGVLAGPLGWGATAARGLFLGGAALEGALAAYGFPQLMVMDLAARAGAVGGEKLTNQTPEEARMNLALGYANLAMAGLDLGLTPGVMGKVARIPGAVRATAGLTRKQSQVLVNSMARHTGNLSDAALAKLLDAVKTADANTTLIVVNGDGSLSQMRPLEGVTERLESTTAARASGKAKNPPKAFDEYANAPTVKPFVGTKVDPNNLPEGYLYGKIPLEDGTFREVVYMPKPNKTRVPLIVEDGKIQMGKPGEYRIVDKAAYDKNVMTDPSKPGKLLGGKSQIHHLFADNMLRNTPFGQRALRLGAVNPDGSINLVELANSTENLAEARKTYPNVKFSDFVHNTQHPKFDGLMQDVVDQEITVVRKAKGFSGKNEEFIPQMTKAEIQEVWNEALTKMKAGLMGEDTELYQKIKTRPNSGSLAQGENPDNSKVA